MKRFSLFFLLICISLSLLAQIIEPPEVIVLAPVEFSQQGGFYSSSFDLNLTHEDSTVTIIYTLDGSEPDQDNLEGTTYQYKNSYPQTGTTLGEFLTNSYTSQTYTSPINIHDRTSEPDKLTQISPTFHTSHIYAPSTPVKKGFIVRAKAFKEGAEPSKTTTHSFFVQNVNSNPYTLPLISISLPENEFFDYYDGIYVAGTDFDTWREENPAGYANAGVPANYHRSGSETEKLAHMEYFSSSGAQAEFSQNMGIRIHGGWSRSFQIKSLRLYARKKYGNSTFDYKFFPGLEDSSFKRLMLRNSGNDYYQFYLRDPIMQKIVEDLNFDTQAYQPVIIFINGEYWGIHNMRERYDADYLERVYAVDGDNVDLLEANAEANEGDSDDYNDLIAFFEAHETINQTDYDYLETRMDMQSFTDYQITEIFSGNADWPFNNIRYWRLKTDAYNPDAPFGHDGRWRWMLYDLDLALGLSGTANPVSDNTLERVTTTNGINDWSTLILRRLLTNDEYKVMFINQFCDYLNSTFMFNRTSDILTTYRLGIVDEIEEHIARFSRPRDYETWNANYSVIFYFLQNRPGEVFQHLQNRFDLDSLRTLSLDVGSLETGYLSVNSLEIKPDRSKHSDINYPWHGSYFSSLPIAIKAIPNPGYKFSHWNEIADTTGAVTIFLDSNTSLTANFVVSSGGDVEKVKPLSLSNAYPNPFNPTTTIKFTINDGATADFNLYNIKGQKVKSFGTYISGSHTVIWDGKNNDNKSVASGLYLYRLKSAQQYLIKKCVLLK